jgi:hypothetical protein
MKKMFLAATACCLFVGLAKGQNNNLLRLSGAVYTPGLPENTGPALELGFDQSIGAGFVSSINRTGNTGVNLPLNLSGSIIKLSGRMLVNGAIDNQQDAVQVNGKILIKRGIESNNIFMHGSHIELQNSIEGKTGGMAFSVGQANSGTIQAFSSSEMNGSLLLNPNGGNVGIGTSSPAQKLTINGGGIGFDWNSADKKLYSPVDGILEWVTHNAAAEHGFAVSHQGDRMVYFNTQGNSYIMGGYLGIGTKNPTVHLAVAGTILAKKVKVSTQAADWPDFVFADEYQLPTIQEVETFIHQHKHLPSIPSAEEVAAQDHDLGDMNKKLLQKVEELTLYIIQQQKLIEAMDTRLKAVEKH